DLRVVSRAGESARCCLLVLWPALQSRPRSLPAAVVRSALRGSAGPDRGDGAPVQVLGTAVRSVDVLRADPGTDRAVRTADPGTDLGASRRGALPGWPSRIASGGKGRHAVQP